MRIKNKDIAQALGISTTTVSLALNGRPGVSEETRRKVLEMIRDSANDNAEAQINLSLKNRTILLCVHKNTGLIINEKPFFSNLIEYFQQEAMNYGYPVVLVHHIPGQSEKQYEDYLRQLDPAGIAVMATEMKASDLDIYKSLHVPVVLMDGYFELSNIDSVSLDDQDAIYRSVAYAYEMGHREIGYLRSSTVIQNFVHHFDGYMKGLRDYNIIEENHPVIDLPCTLEGAYNEMNVFLDHIPEGFRMPTVFIADLDYIAIGAMQALSNHGYRIPEDISMIGYDDIASSALYNPPLTTSRVNQGITGMLAMRRLKELLDGTGTDFYIDIHLSSSLIIRDSVKKIN